MKTVQMGDMGPVIGMHKGAEVTLGDVLSKLSFRNSVDMKDTPARAVRNMVQPAKVYGLASMRELLSRMR
jgi:hypothetical protein